MKRSGAQERLDALAHAHGLDAGQRSALASLLASLGRPEAPTTVHAPAQAADVHLADALVALELPEVRSASTLADLGSGVGVPGLALAVALPSSRMVLVESHARKCTFLRDAVAAAGLANVEVVCARAESWAAGAGTCDVVTARAVAALAVLCEYAAPLLRTGGLLVAWKGEVEETERADGDAAAGMLGLAPEPVRAASPYAGSERRTLHVYRKVSETPERFPRRPGMATKRPLGRPS